MPVPDIEIMEDGQSQAYAKVSMEKQQWKAYVKEHVKKILKYKPEAVFCIRRCILYLSGCKSTQEKNTYLCLQAWKRAGKNLL